MNRTTFETTSSRPRFDRLALATVAFAALLVLATLAVTSAMAGVLLGAFGFAVAVTLVTALPFLVVRAVSDAALR
ncbi:hypothetical protein [Halomarina rubra]|uniref:Uncharacterized protein n=1 Tax=Halomarina rubra TaxID=2071873 RepID=A0ABD6AT61_9EURY|nr:hypothetical protein [Halomarina rubra]